jgi:hypothetical protein
VGTALVPLNGLGAGDLGRWRELADVVLEPNPFFEPDYLLPLARSLGELDEVALAVVTEGDSWVACMPVHRADRWHRIPLPSIFAWRGRGLLPALIGTPLISSARAQDATVALVGSLARSPGSFFAALECLVEGGPVFHAVRSALAESGLRSLCFEHVERAFLTRRPEDDYLEQAMGAKRRRNLRAQWRSLGEELGEELQVVDRADEEAAVAQFIELEGRSHLAELGTVLSSDPGQARFFGEMCAAFAARGRLQLLALQAGDHTIAMKCNILADPGVFYLKIAYEEKYARFSPGIQLEARMFTLFHERTRAGWIDSCASPNNETFNRLLPGRRSLVTLAIADRTIRTLPAIPIIRGAAYLHGRRMTADSKPTA